LPNWTNLPEIGESDHQIKSKYDLKDKFVAVFGGNFGIPQKTEFIIDVADKIKDRKEIIFLLIGEGTEKNKIKQVVLDKKLENVRILDQLTRNEYLMLVKECDVGLVNLSDKFTIPNIPSRTLSYWSLRLPVLAAVDENTDYGDLLTCCSGGLWSVTGDTDAYIANLLTFFYNPETRKQFGENGYNYLIRELNTEVAYNTIMSKAE
jgi:glycosyltransferase involved in cell wall biosynthesis